MLAAPLLALAAAAAPAPGLRALERGFVCPERLADDDARMTAVRVFVVRYRALVPAATFADALAARDRLMARRRCKPETLQHSFPEQ